MKASDIDYYVKEWNVHNVAYKHLKLAAKKLGWDVDIVIKRAEHVDLNTDDPKHEIYEKWGGVCGWLD